MKKIYLLRHAKAQKEIISDDFSRKLTKKGKNELKMLFEKLKKYEVSFDFIFSSPAKRTQSTAKKVAQFYNFPKDIIYIDAFYEARASDLFDFIGGLDSALQNILIIGHNPALLELCELLSDLCLSSFPTASMLCLQFDLDDFAKLKAHSGKLVFFEHIKAL